MYFHIYPGRDPGEETDASFKAAIEIIPAATKRRFGYRVNDLNRQADEQDEIERLIRHYTPWAARAANCEGYDDGSTD